MILSDWITKIASEVFFDVLPILYGMAVVIIFALAAERFSLRNK